MVRLIAMVLLGAALVAAGARDAAACDRARSPLEARAVAVSVADVVVIADVTAIHDGVATVTVVSALKGGRVGGDRLRVRGVTEAGLGRDCGVRPIAVGERHVFLLWAPTGAIAEHQLVDPVGGLDDVAADTDRVYAAAVAAAPVASAARVSGPVEAWLLREPDASGGEVDLVVLVRNVGKGDLRWSYRSWPRATQSRCALDLADAAGHRVPARPVPIAARDIRDYFAKHGPRYDLTLASGDTAMLGLDRVTTAAPGWGYKERLGFVFYPPPAPGRYRVQATCTNLVRRRTIVTAALDLML